jgi:SPX domain protein involved in polyphosphate accumulation
MLYKILKKHDKRTKMKVANWILVRLEKESFWTPKFDDLIVGLSDAYAELRSMTRKAQRSSSFMQEDVEQFERKTEKYFVLPENIMEVKTTIMKHLPVDIFGRKKEDASTDKSDYLESLKGLSDSNVINSIYLDNDVIVSITNLWINCI